MTQMIDLRRRGLLRGSGITVLSEIECATGWAANATASKDVQLNFSTATTPIGGSVYSFDARYEMPSL